MSENNAGRPTEPVAVGGWAKFAGNNQMALKIAAVVVVVALAAAVGLLSFNRWQDGLTQQARTDAVEAARDQAVAMLAYDFTDVDNQLASAADGLTGEFRDEYTKLVQETIAPGAKEKQLTVQVSVQAAAPVSTTPTEAVVLLYLNQITTSAEAPEARTSGSRVRMSLEKVGDRWLVDQLTPV
ncbi:h domain protein [Rhodococcus sp. NPDC049939]|uniref:h domain protein n=1 Tax=Rhodococcus sp. NPDC049939 TaxID=3155511 RepID=UPI0033C7B56E